MAIRTTLLTKSIRQPGSYSFGPFDINQSISQVNLQVVRDTWLDTGGNVFKAIAEISLDGGSSWQFWFSFSTCGGETINPHTGLVDNTSGVIIAVPDVGNLNRCVRGTVEVAVVLNLELAIEVS